MEAWTQDGNFSRVMNQGTLNERIEQGVTIPVSGIEFELIAESQEERKIGDGGFCADPTNDDVTWGEPLLGGALEVHLTIGKDDIDIHPGEEIILHLGDPGSPQAIRGRITGSDRDGVKVKLKAPYQSRVF